MKPGIPKTASRASLEGHYDLDPSVRFWATPPIHGCLTTEVVHPAAFTFKLRVHVFMAEGAMVEPFAVGLHAATKAEIKPGSTALVVGCGPIGIMVALAANLSAEKLANDAAVARRQIWPLPQLTQKAASRISLKRRRNCVDVVEHRCCLRCV